jgi:KipI family sensor histidine kinase inhibitor
VIDRRGRRIRSAGDAAVLLDWPGETESAGNRKARAVRAHLVRERPAGLIDAVPAARSLLVRFDPRLFDRGGFESRSGFWETDFAILGRPRLHEIPVWYGGPAGVDLEELSAERGIPPAKFVELHCATRYTVAFLGFTPGFPYLAGLPESLAARRRETPRTQVPAGSVAIGGQYAGIYPAATPGGWRLIGRTPVTLFDADREKPATLEPGDEVRFFPIPGERFATLVSTGGVSRP